MVITREKDAVLQIRIPADLKTAFLKACDSEDLSAAQVLRRFIRSYVENRKQLSLQLPRATQKPADDHG